MQNRTSTKISRFAQGQWGIRLTAGAAVTAATLAAVGCGVGTMGTATVTPTPATLNLQGSVMGGQQPVSGATLQLYAANQVGYNQASTSLISSSVTSDAGGNFSITGTYTCPYSTSQVYIVATGGNSGTGTNSNISMMAPLGSCGNLNASTFIIINELTTVAGAYALSGFMSSPTQMSTSSTNVVGLTNAFATVNKLVNVSKGSTSGTTLPATATAPVALLNTLADILASCVNTNGVGGSSTNCSTLFTNATPPGGTAPTDTLTAALNIAKNPGNNVGGLFPLATSTGPFQPTLATAPTAYTMSIKYAPTGAFSSPSSSAVDASGNLWVTNPNNNSVTILNATTSAPTVLTTGNLNKPSSIAFDAAGNAWVPNRAGSLSVFTPAGSGSLALSTGLSTPGGVAVDGQGTVWVTNNGNNTVSAVAVSGTSVNGVNSYSLGGTSPAAIAINPR